MRIAALLLINFLCVFEVFSEGGNPWEQIKPYILKTKKLTSFNGIKFCGSENEGRSGSLMFTENDNPIKINFDAEIPYDSYCSFFESVIKSNKHPYFLVHENCGETNGKSYVALTIPEDLPKPNSDGLKIFPLFYRIVKDSVYEVVMFFISNYKIEVCTFIYDETQSNVLSSLSLYHQAIDIDPTEQCDRLEDLTKFNNYMDDSNYFTISIDHDIYTIYATLENLGVQLGIRAGNEVYKFNYHINRYEQIWSSIFYFPENVPSHIFEDVDEGREVVVIRDPHAIECEIQDKDGFVNVREAPNKNAKIMYRIKEKEKFIIESEDCNGWYRVIMCGENTDGGWIHNSRVKKLKTMNSDLKYSLPKLYDDGEYTTFDEEDSD